MWLMPLLIVIWTIIPHCSDVYLDSKLLCWSWKIRANSHIPCMSAVDPIKPRLTGSTCWFHIFIQLFTDQSFCHNLAYDVPKLWNDQIDGVSNSISIAFLAEVLKFYLFSKAFLSQPPRFPYVYGMTRLCQWTNFY